MATVFPFVMKADSIPIVDCHCHFLDAHQHTYPIFQQRSPGLEALVGDYSALPRCYLPDDYLRDANGFHVVKIVWAEFMSTDPSREVRWAENLSDEQAYPQGIIALVDFLSPDIENSPFLWLSRARPCSPPAFGLAPEQSFTALCDSVRRMG